MTLINKRIEAARKLINEKNYQEAIVILEDLFKNTPRSEEVKKYLVEALFEGGGYFNDVWVVEHERAAVCFKRIIELDPNNYRAYYNLGITYYNLGCMDLALKMCENALKLKPNYKHCYYNIGLIYEAKNDLIKALEYYDRALQLDPKFTYPLQAREIVRKELDFMRENKSLSD